MINQTTKQILIECLNYNIRLDEARTAKIINAGEGTGGSPQESELTPPTPADIASMVSLYGAAKAGGLLSYLPIVGGPIQDITSSIEALSGVGRAGKILADMPRRSSNAYISVMGYVKPGTWAAQLENLPPEPVEQKTAEERERERIKQAVSDAELAQKYAALKASGAIP